MKRGTTIKWDRDLHDKSIVLIQKRRGHLTLEEIGDILQHEDGGKWNGRYAILMNCSEGTLGGNGLFMADPAGDSVELYQLESETECPVCGRMLPPFEYCPNCGNDWRDMENSVEKRLSSIRQEAAWEIRKAALTPEAHAAWYWSYIGAVDMARQMNFITEERRRELYQGAEELKPEGHHATEHGQKIEDLLAMKLHAGDYVNTPRFCSVQIERVYRDEVEMRRDGYTEPTDYRDREYVVCGKSTGLNRMVFAAARRKAYGI